MKIDVDPKIAGPVGGGGNIPNLEHGKEYNKNYLPCGTYTGIKELGSGGSADLYVVSYVVEPIWIWKPSDAGCSDCQSLGGRYTSYPGASGSVHKKCKCKVTKVIRARCASSEPAASCELCERVFRARALHGVFCLECVERFRKLNAPLCDAYDDAALNCAAGASAAKGLSKVTTEPVAKGCAESSYWFLGTLGVGFKLGSRYLRELEKDPPDEQYKKPVRLKQKKIKLPKMPAKVPKRLINKIVSTQSKGASYFGALRESMEKFTYAAQVYDHEFIKRQRKSVAKYKKGVFKALGRQKKLFDEVITEMKNSGSELDIKLKQSDIKKVKKTIAAKGFSKEQIAIYRAFGFTSKEIGDMRKQVAKMSSKSRSLRVSDALRKHMKKFDRHVKKWIPEK